MSRCRCDLCMYDDPPPDVEIDEEPDDEDEGPTDAEIERAQDRFEERVYGDRE